MLKVTTNFIEAEFFSAIFHGHSAVEPVQQRIRFFTMGHLQLAKTGLQYWSKLYTGASVEVLRIFGVTPSTFFY